MDCLDNRIPSHLILLIFVCFHIGNIVPLVLSRPARQVFHDESYCRNWRGFLYIGRRSWKVDGVYVVGDLENIYRMELLVSVFKYQTLSVETDSHRRNRFHLGRL